MTIDVQMSDLSLEIEDDRETQELYVNLYQTNGARAADNTEGAMDCDDDIAGDLEFAQQSDNTDEEEEDGDQLEEEEEIDDEETLEGKHTRVKAYCDLHFNQPEFESDDKIKKKSSYEIQR
jgi:hypothetical protein